MGLFSRKTRVADPVRCTAHVLAVRQTRDPQSNAAYRSCSMEILVQPPHGDPFQATAKKAMLKSKQHPQPGESIPVVVDRRDPSVFEVCWDDLPTAADRIAGRAAQLTAPEPSGPAASGASTADEIADLVELHRSGALSDEEFRLAKQRVLDVDR